LFIISNIMVHVSKQAMASHARACWGGAGLTAAHATSQFCMLLQRNGISSTG
jgi:hypothetical protein